MDAAALKRPYQRAEITVSGEQNDLVDVLGEIQRIDRNLDIHIAFDLTLAAGIDVLLGGLRDDRVAVVVEPVDQWPNRGRHLIFNDRRVIEGAHERTATREFVK